MVYQVEDGEADHEGVKVSLDSNSLVEDVNGGLRVKRVFLLVNYSEWYKFTSGRSLIGKPAKPKALTLSSMNQCYNIKVFSHLCDTFNLKS
jgi:hypothetical protein